jgi:calcineurin-like phosphoesterase family protein
MSNVYFISDLHFGHKNILNFEPVLRSGLTYLENMYNIADNWIKTVRKRDLVWVLGDCAFTEEGFRVLESLPGRKKLVRGNHDNYYTTEDWLQIFETVESLVYYKKFWLSHCPIHPNELRGRTNIHGHVHSNSIRDIYGVRDKRYINVCCEAVGNAPINVEKIKDNSYWRLAKC